MERRYDLIIFGATGVTGKFLVEELAKCGGHISWAIAGRSEKKLLETRTEISAITGVDISHAGVIVADVQDSSLLINMCQQAKIVVNCVGPFRFYGEPVVQACIECSTDYIDVCGEPQFLEKIQLKYFEEASTKKLYIVGACGFDSLPCDMGVEFLRQKFIEHDTVFAGRLNSVESYLEIFPTKDSKGNYATWLSALHSITHASELKPLRIKLTEKVFPRADRHFAFWLAPRPVLFKSESINKWCLPFLGSDKSVVTRSQMYRQQFENERPIQIQTYFGVSSLLYALLFIFMAGLFAVLTKFRFGRYLLEEYPGFFSCGLITKTPATRQQCIGDSFSLTFIGNGWSRRSHENEHPDKRMKVKITGPGAGYITTAICTIAASLTLLDENERKKMSKGGGVLTPAAAFAKTDLIQKLERRGVVMTVID